MLEVLRGDHMVSGCQGLEHGCQGGGAGLKRGYGFPPSRSLTHSSKSVRVGLPERPYTKPVGYVPSGSRSKVVNLCIGGVTAPVVGSTFRPL